MPNVPVPYVIAIVELEEQADLRIATNIVDCEPDSVHVGLPVEVRFERHEVDGDTVFFPVFAPRSDDSWHVDIWFPLAYTGNRAIHVEGGVSMRRIVAFFAVLLCCGVYGGAHALASAGVDTPGVLQFGGLDRTYLLHVPADVEHPSGSGDQPARCGIRPGRAGFVDELQRRRRPARVRGGVSRTEST